MRMKCGVFNRGCRRQLSADGSSWQRQHYTEYALRMQKNAVSKHLTSNISNRPATSATDRQQKNLDITAFFEVLLMLLPETLFYLYSFLLYVI